MNKVKSSEKISKNKFNINIYNSIKEAANDITTKMDNWKVQMLIVDAINTGKVAFKRKWYKA